MTTATENGDADLRARLRHAIEKRTLTRVSVELGVSREALLRFLALVELQAGSLELIRGKLAKLGGRS